MLTSKHFPPPKVRALANEVRRDRGANSKRLTCTEVQQTSKPTVAGDGVPMAVPCGQLPGCLPNGYTLDSLLTREQFCIWRRVSMEWLKPRIHCLPGAVKESRQNILIHARTYLEKSTKGK